MGGKSSIYRWVRITAVGLAAISALLVVCWLGGFGSAVWAQETTEVRDDAGKPLVKIELVKVLSLDSYAVGVAWSPDGKRVATLDNWWKTLKIWRTDTWLIERVDKAFPDRHFQFSPDGKYYITRFARGPGRGALQVVDAGTGKVFRRLDDPIEQNTVIKGGLVPKQFFFSRDNTRLYALFDTLNGETNAILATYDTKIWNLLDAWNIGSVGFNHMLAGQDRDEVIATSQVLGDRTATQFIQTWSVKEHKLVRQFPVTSESMIFSVEVDWKNGVVATAQGGDGSRIDERTGREIRHGDDEYIKLWQLVTGEKTSSVRARGAQAGLAFSRSGNYLIADAPCKDVGDKENRCTFPRAYYLYRTRDMKNLGTIHTFQREAWAPSFSPDGHYLALVGDYEVRIYSFSELQ